MAETVPVTRVEEQNPYGPQGPRFSRTAPFLRGFIGALGVLAALLFGFAVREAASALTLVLIAGFLAVGLDPIVEVAVRRGAKRGWAVLVVALAVLGVLTAFAVILGGALRTQVTSLIDNAPGLLEDLRRNRTVAHLDAKYHVISALEDRLRSPDFATTTFGGIFQAGLSVLNAVVGPIVVVDPHAVLPRRPAAAQACAYSLAPASRRERVAKLGDEILRRVGRYVIGAAVVALIAGTVTLIFLLIVGLGQYALPLALLVALLDLVPMVGVDHRRGQRLHRRPGDLAPGRRRLHHLLPRLRDARGLRHLPAGHAVVGRRARIRHDRRRARRRCGGRRSSVPCWRCPSAAGLLLIMREVWVRRQDVS